ncbi:MAG: hypothetical protein ACR2OU_21135 [Thermomicrobiales bacterium]
MDSGLRPVGLAALRSGGERSFDFARRRCQDDGKTEIAAKIASRKKRARYLAAIIEEGHMAG